MPQKPLPPSSVLEELKKIQKQFLLNNRLSTAILLNKLIDKFENEKI